jgi:aryl-alcohol dehydrogenase-like predicted oxidoreductase
LGSRGPEITRLGLGASSIGGHGWGPVDDEESIAAIRHAIDGGINWVDTAASYGQGHSEEIVGRAIEPYTAGEDVLVFTKCGLRWSDDDPGTENNLTPESIRFECEKSLERLGVERIDLFQFHWPDELGTPVEDSWGTMVELIVEGKVRWGGVSNFDVKLLDRCEAIRHVDSVQPPLSLIDREALHEVIPWAHEHGTGVIAYSPMASGLLTGGYTKDRAESLTEDDWRRDSPAFREPALSKTLAGVERLRTEVEWMNTTVPSLAVAWTLRQPGVTGAIVGARRPEQVDGWLPAGDLELDDDTARDVEAAFT